MSPPVRQLLDAFDRLPPDDQREALAELSRRGTRAPVPDLAADPGLAHRHDYGEQDENGVDLSLIRHMLSLTPLQRIEMMEQAAQQTRMLNEHGRKYLQSAAAENR